MNFHPVVVQNFIELGRAFEELDRGIVRGFLRPTAAQNRAPSPGDIWSIKAMFAIALDVIAGDPHAELGEAANQIAKNFSFIADVVSPDTKDFAGLMLSWRKHFLKGKVPDQQAQLTFNSRADLIDQIGNDLIARGEQITGPRVSAEILMGAVLLLATASDADAIKRVVARMARKGKKPPS
ncbi:hypothetical protein [Methylocystis sp. ATCC 49242]|uniref:hypothetical protein n=1 Tax=Methylocystis sp. ATCC 49242 TaxID=622637 RepID=UPI0005664B98|nr:hypothetical protein [Methylocystis sp. ATCC 49242]